jgi:enamine deaminase RidA (YjgF/YER057c/UK114 family)
MTSFVAADDPEVYPLFQVVRSELMAGNLPASATVKVAGFVFPGMHLEIKATAVTSASNNSA